MRCPKCGDLLVRVPPDYCGRCGEDRCPQCMEGGCCGRKPALSGIEVSTQVAADDGLPEPPEETTDAA
jgi:hypothetical protein